MIQGLPGGKLAVAKALRQLKNSKMIHKKSNLAWFEKKFLYYFIHYSKISTSEVKWALTQ